MSPLAGWGLYLLEITVLTPLHIGGGVRYQRDYDFVAQRSAGRPPSLRLFDVETALELLDDATIRRVQNGAIAAAIPEELYDRVTRAELPVYGTREVGQELHGAIRDGQGQLYLPGSSLKGAFRSALLDAYASAHPAEVLDYLRGLGRSQAGRPRRERAAGGLEDMAFGVTLPRPGPGRDAPNRDINRWLRIGDAYPTKRPAVVAAEVQVRAQTSRGKQAIPLWVEAVAPGTVFRAELSLAPGSFSPWRELDDERRQLFGSNILGCLKTWGRALADAELDYWSRHDSAVASRFRGAIDVEAHAVFPLGFGTGWLSKTVGRHIRSAPDGKELLSRLIREFRLSRSRSPDPANFPVGHRVIEGPGGPVPMGWVAVTGAVKR